MDHDKQAFSGIPPVLAQALGGIANAPAQARAGMVEAYKKALAGHDWAFAHADDGNAYRRGRDNFAQITAARRELDPTGEIWNQHAPEGHKFTPKAAPVVA
ncbi:MAG: hypothetical protein WAQ08_15915 [Aquabacterium sp.]|uniref:hypothetical protein n=1 Tax=Aquabacterium sp. TaxID=1872578 RepID=UPI003BAF8FBC